LPYKNLKQQTQCKHLPPLVLQEVLGFELRQKIRLDLSMPRTSLSLRSEKLFRPDNKVRYCLLLPYRQLSMLVAQ
jgi:hypothetical protein